MQLESGDLEKLGLWCKFDSHLHEGRVETMETKMTEIMKGKDEEKSTIMWNT